MKNKREKTERQHLHFEQSSSYSIQPDNTLISDTDFNSLLQHKSSSNIICLEPIDLSKRFEKFTNQSDSCHDHGGSISHPIQHNDSNIHEEFSTGIQNSFAI